jgi:hypothetical protein
MAKYKHYEYLPWWLNNLNDNTLRHTEKEVLNLDYYCKKHGTKLSHDKAAERLERSRHAIYLARRRLADLGLRTTEPAKGSFKLGHPIEYQDEAEFWAQLKARGVDPRRLTIKRKSSSKKKIDKQSSSSSKVTEATAETAEAGASFPQTPEGSTNRCSGETGDSAATRKAKDELLWKVVYRGALSKLLSVPYPRDQAERLARIKADKLLVQKNSQGQKK